MFIICLGLSLPEALVYLLAFWEGDNLNPPTNFSIVTLKNK